MTENINILLIDSTVNDYQTVINSCNANTFTIVYTYNSTRDSIMEDISKCMNQINAQKINRIGIFADQKATLFLENDPFFLDDDNSLFFSDNISFIVSLINEYDVSYIDYFACNTLNNPKWVEYYDILMSLTNATVGASNNETGNIQYGGDWVMESTCQDIESIYFTKNIEYYKYLLATTYFYVDTGLYAFDITELFITPSTAGIITNTNYKNGGNDIISTLSMATSEITTGYRVTNYFINYLNANPPDYRDVGRFIQKSSIIPTLTFSSSSSISSVTGTYGKGYFINYVSTSLTLTVSKNCICYILAVGGGSSGGSNKISSSPTATQGGCGGGIVYGYVKLNTGTSYTITIGKGGTGVSGSDSAAGGNTLFVGTDFNITADGGKSTPKSGSYTEASGSFNANIRMNAYNGGLGANGEQNPTNGYTIGTNSIDAINSVNNPSIANNTSLTTRTGQIAILANMYNLISANSAIFLPGTGFCGGGARGINSTRGLRAGLNAIGAGGTYSSNSADGQDAKYGCGGGGGAGSAIGAGGNGGDGFIYLYLDKQ